MIQVIPLPPDENAWPVHIANRLLSERYMECRCTLTFENRILSRDELESYTVIDQRLAIILRINNSEYFWVNSL